MALIKCKECGHDVSDKAEMCPNCGCPIEKKIYCEECGQELSTKDKVCTNCGYPITEGHLSKVTKTENIAESGGKSGMIKYFIAIVSYIVISVIACALAKRTYSPFIETEAIVSNEILLCTLVAVLLILIFARRFIDRFVLCILVTLISLICCEIWETLWFGTAVVVHLVCIASIIVAVYKGQSPTKFPYLDSINGWGPKILLCIAGVIGYISFELGFLNIIKHEGGVVMPIECILLSILMIYVAKKISKNNM